MTRVRVLQVLAGLWILDGLLQLQPMMFTTAMAHSILQPLSAGEPGWMQAVVRLSIAAISSNPPLTNGLIAAIQLLLGGALLWRGRQRLWPLWASLTWSGLLWVFGQALGGLLTGQASLLSGGPGSAVLYALLTWAAWPCSDEGAAAARRRTLAVALGALWALGAVVQAQPAFFSASGLGGLVGGLAAGQPTWLANLLQGGAAALGRAPATANGLVAALMALTAAGLWVGGALLRPALALSGVLSAAAWVFGQAFGMMFTGLSTDPNSAPLYAILALVVWEAGGRGGRTILTGPDGTAPDRTRARPSEIRHQTGWPQGRDEREQGSVRTTVGVLGDPGRGGRGPQPVG